MSGNYYTSFSTGSTGTPFTKAAFDARFGTIDRVISHHHNIQIHADGDIKWNKGTGTLTYPKIWIHYNTSAGHVINWISSGSTTITDDKFVYVTLSTAATSLTLSQTTISAGSTLTVPYNRLILGYRNATSDEFYPSPALGQKWQVNLPSTLGSANQILGMDGSTATIEYKTIQGTTDEIDVTHAAGSITIGLVNPLAAAKGGTGLSDLGGANQVLGVTTGASALEYKTLAGTANQVTVTPATTQITLSLANITSNSTTLSDTNATPLCTYTLTEGKAYLIQFFAAGREGAPIVNSAAYGKIASVSRSTGSSAVLLGSVGDIFTDIESTSVWNATIDTTGNDVRGLVQGQSSAVFKGKMVVIEV